MTGRAHDWLAQAQEALDLAQGFIAKAAGEMGGGQL